MYCIMSTDKNYITDEELINDSYDNNLLNRNVMFSTII